MPIRLDIFSNPKSAVAGLETVEAAVKALVTNAVASNEKIAASAKAVNSAVAAGSEGYKAVAVASAQSAMDQISESKNIIAAKRQEIETLRAIEAEYKHVGEAAQIAAKLRMDAERSVQAMLGETIAAERSVGRAARGSALRSAEGGALRGGITRGLGIGGALAGPGFIIGAGGVVEARAALGAVKDMQVSLALLRQAVASTGKSWNVYGDDLLKVVRKQEELSGFSRNDLRASLATLVRVTKDPAEAMKLLATATDLARARHTDLDTATRILTRTWVTGGRGLARLGIESVKVTTNMDKLREAHIKVNDSNRAQVLALTKTAQHLDLVASRTASLDKINSTFSGSARKYMGTAQGATEKLHNSIEELQISIGKALLPQIAHLADGISKWLDEQRKAGTLQKNMNGYIETAGQLFHDLWEALKLVVAILTPLVDAVGGLNNALKILIGYMLVKRVIMFAAALSTELVAALVATETAAEGAAGAKGIGLLIRNLRILTSAEMLASLGTLGLAVGAIGVAVAGVGSTIFGPNAGDTGGPSSNVGGLSGQQINNATPAQLRAFQTWLNKHPHAKNQTLGQLYNSNPAFRTYVDSVLNPQDSAGFDRTPGRMTQSGAPPTTFANRVTSPTAGLQALQGDLPGPKGSPAIGYSGHAHKSYHYAGEALDIGDGGNPASLISDWNFLFPLRNNFAELIWDPPAKVQARAPGSGAGYFYGVPGAFSDHKNHIHVAFTGTPSELKNIMSKAKSQNAADTASTFEADIAAAKARETPPKPHKGPKTGAGATNLQIKSGRLTQEQEDNARLIYKMARGAGLTPDQALQMVAVAFAESNLDNDAVNKASGAFGLFQLLSPGYKKAYEKYLAQGYDSATANIMAILPSYEKYFKQHPHAASGAAGAAVEASGEGAAFYRRGIGSVFTLGGKSAGTTTATTSQSALITARAQITAAIKAAEHELGLDQTKISTSLASAGIGFDSPVGQALNISPAIMKTIADAEAHLRVLRAKLSKPLTSTEYAKARASIKQWETTLSDALKSAGDTASTAATIATNHLNNAVRDVDQQMQRAFDAQTQAYEKNFNRQTNAFVTAFNKDTQRMVDAMQIRVQSTAGSFLFGGSIDQTPSEKALAALQNEQQNEDLQKAVTDASKQLDTAKLIGDPKVIADAEQALRDAQRNVQIKALEDSAKIERDAADKQLDAAKQAFEERRNAEIEAYQEQRSETLSQYDQMRSDQWQAFTDMEADWKVLLDANVISWVDYVNNLRTALRSVGVNLGDAIFNSLLGLVNNPAAKHDIPGTGSRVDSNGNVIIGSGGSSSAHPAQTGRFSTVPEILMTGDVAGGEFIVPRLWLPPALRDAVGEVLRQRNAPGSQRIPRDPVAAAGRSPLSTPTGGYETGSVGPGGTTIVIHAPQYVQGSVVTERELALKSRDHLVRIGRTIGGDMFGGQA